METPEVHVPHAHRKRRGRRDEGLPKWLELAVAVTALITSISSIVLAVGNGKSMDKLVKANSIPYLIGTFSNVTPEGTDQISIDLLNAGVGPAHETSLRMLVDGHYVRSTKELIAASLGPQATADEIQSLHSIKNNVRTRFISGGKSQLVIRIAKTAQNAKAWDRLSNAQSRWDIDYCYCSVFDECWAVHPSTEPQPIKQCTRDEAHEFQP